MDTAKLIRKKISEGKSTKNDEEIDSGDSADDWQAQGDGIKNKDGAISQIDKDPFFAKEQEDENENADERRLKLTKKLIKELGEESKDKEKSDFFVNLQTNTTSDVNIITEEDDHLRKQLKYKILEQRDKLFYNLAKDYGS